MNSRTEKIWTEMVKALSRCYPTISPKVLKKIGKTSVSTVGVPTNIQIEDFPKPRALPPNQPAQRECIFFPCNLSVSYYFSQYPLH
jgi:hypothetical protein